MGRILQEWEGLGILKKTFPHISTRWLGGATAGRQTCDHEVVGSTVDSRSGRLSNGYYLDGTVDISVYNQPPRSTQPSIPPG